MVQFNPTMYCLINGRNYIPSSDFELSPNFYSTMPAAYDDFRTVSGK